LAGRGLYSTGQSHSAQRCASGVDRSARTQNSSRSFGGPVARPRVVFDRPVALGAAVRFGRGPVSPHAEQLTLVRHGRYGTHTAYRPR
jgi:hypothetical protein